MPKPIRARLSSRCAVPFSTQRTVPQTAGKSPEKMSRWNLLRLYFSGFSAKTELPNFSEIYFDLSL
jgi:hypothetical protein